MNFKNLIRSFVRLLPPIFVTIISAFLITVLTKTVIVEPGNKKSTHDKLFEYLETGLSQNLFNEEYCRLAFNHFDRKSDGNLKKYGYVESLEDFVVYLNSKKSEDTGKQAHSQAVMAIVQHAKKVEPFASLPSEEKRLMDNIQTFIQNNDDDNSLSNLQQLKQVILARHKEYQKIEQQNKWSIPLAFAGVAFTLFFGIWSTIIAIRKERISIIHNMTNDVSTNL